MDPYLTLDAPLSNSSPLLTINEGVTTSFEYFGLDFNINNFISEETETIGDDLTHSVHSRKVQREEKKSTTSPLKSRSKRSSGTVSTSKNAARERSRVKSLRTAFQNLQKSLPYVPPNTKLSKLDVLILATTYISHLMKLLGQGEAETGSDYNCSTAYPLQNVRVTGKLPSLFHHNSPPLEETILQIEARHSSRSRLWESNYLHPVKKWPMRSRLYAGVGEDYSAKFGQPFTSNKAETYDQCTLAIVFPGFVDERGIVN